MMKILRSSSEKSTKFKTKWENGMKVHCRIPNTSPVQWKIGTTSNVSEKINGKKDITIHFEDTDEAVIIPADQASDYLREVDPVVQFLQKHGSQKFVYKMFKNLLSREETTELQKEFTNMKEGDFDFMKLLDRITRSYEADLKEDEHYKNTKSPATSVIYALKRLLDKDESAKEIIKKATEGKAAINDPFIVLAFVVARIIGIELQYEMMRDDGNNSNDAKALIDDLSRIVAGDTNEFGTFDCQVTKVFLFTVMTTTLKKSKSYDPKGSTFDNRRKVDIATCNETFEAAVSKATTCMSCLHAGQSDSLVGLGKIKLIRSLILYLDKKGGISEKLIKELSSTGLCVDPKTLLKKVFDLSQSIDPNDIRHQPSDGAKSVLCFLFDNADFHIYANCISMIVAGTILIGYESNSDQSLLHQDYIRLLPKPCPEKDISNILSTEYDEEVAQHGICLQNIHALILATACKNEQFLHSKKVENENSNHGFTIGQIVLVHYRNGDIEAKIIEVNEKIANLEIIEGNGDRVEPNPVYDVWDLYQVSLPVGTSVLYQESIDASIIRIEKAGMRVIQYYKDKEAIEIEVSRDDLKPKPECESEENGNINSEKDDTTNECEFNIDDEMEHFVIGKDDGAGRCKIEPPATTVVTDILSGMSSKHDIATMNVIERYIDQHAENTFWETVHVLIADQEFSPTIFRQFFSSLHSEKKLPFILSLAMGHVYKNMATSMLNFYRVILKDLFVAQGITPGSQEHKRIMKGTNIRETVKWLVQAIETKRIADAITYLRSEGNKKINGMNQTPNKVLDELLSKKEFDAKIHKHCSKDETAVCLGSDCRPTPIPINENVTKVANNFEMWVRNFAKGNTNEEIWVGPSGFVHGEETAVENAKSISLQTSYIPQYTEDNVEENLKYVFTLPYYDDEESGREGILNLCKNANILDKNHRRGREFLQDLYIVYKRATISNNNDESIGRKVAQDWMPLDNTKFDKNQRKEICMTSLLYSRLLFGPETYSLLRSVLLTRWRPNPKSGKNKCVCCSKMKNNCACSHNYEFVVVLKALMASSFMRNHPNYQKLLLNQLIHISGIMRHPNDRIRILALQRIQWTWALSEKGDTFLGEPADLLQELRLVAMTKQNVRKVKHDAASLIARVKINSFINVKRVEASHRSYQLMNTSSEKNDQKMRKEAIRFRTNLCFFYGLNTQLYDESNDRSLLRIIGTKATFRDKRVLFHREIDSVFYMVKAAEETLKANSNGYDIKLPTRPILAIKRFDKESSDAHSNKRKRDKSADLRTALKKQRNDNIQAAMMQSPCYVPVMGNEASIFHSLDKCGENKATIIFDIMKLLRKNHEWRYTEDRIGEQITRPIHLSRDRYTADRNITKRANGKPLFLLVDGCKDLQIAPIRRLGGKYQYTLKELARDIIMMWISLYCKKGVNVVVIFIDDNDLCSALRQIQRMKRNKNQNEESHFLNQKKNWKSDDPMSSIGDFVHLMTHYKSGFGQLLAQEIASNLKSADISDEDWKPSEMFKDVTFGFIGPKSKVFVGANKNVTISSNVVVSRSELERRTADITKQGEGERMIISFMAKIFCIVYQYHFKNNVHEVCDTNFELHCEDSDIIVSSIFLIQSLDFAKKTAEKVFRGSIVIRGREKSATSLMKLGETFVENLQVDMNQQPNGKGWVTQIDAIALFYNLEDEEKLSSLPERHRALSALTIAFVFMNCDYIPPMKGFGYKHFIDALVSKEYGYASENFSTEFCSPLFLKPYTFNSWEGANAESSSLNLSGLLLVFAVMAMKRKKTNVLFKKKYPGKLYKELFKREQLPDLYNTIRAMSLYSGEDVPLPSPIAIMNRVAAANFIFQQCTYNIYQDVITPPVDEGELDATPFCFRFNKESNTKVVDVEYTLLPIISKELLKQMKKDGDNFKFDDALRSTIETRLYGSIFKTSNIVCNGLWIFNLKDEIVKAMKNQGISPDIQVPGDKVVPELLARTYETLKEYVDKANEKDDNNRLSTETKETLECVFVLFLTSKTKYNPRGAGAPLLVSNTLKNVLTNGGEWECRYELPEKYAEEKVKKILDMIGGEDHDEILKLLLAISSEVDKLSGENNILRLVLEEPQVQLLDDDSSSSDSEGTVELLDADDNLASFALEDDDYSIEHETNMIEDVDMEL